MKKGLDALRVKRGNLILYQAGLPSFPRIVARDTVITAMLLKDAGMMYDFLEFAVKHQGKKKDPLTGEEPGKIPHEVPPAEIRGLQSKYNSCDSTALFLLGIREYIRWTKDWGFVNNNLEEIRGAVKYILSHVKKGIFYEDPAFCGADKFSLKATYWKDSEMPGRKDGEALFPVCYTLAHVQNMAGLKAAAYLLKDESLKVRAEEMRTKLIGELYDKDTGFIIAKDKKGEVKAISSDSLHSLFYMDKGDIPDEQAKNFERLSRELETVIGYRAIESKKENLYKRNYHSGVVWPFEQALIHVGGRRFALRNVMKNADKIIHVLQNDNEYFTIDKTGTKYKKAGADPQLWTIATKKYFGLY